MVYVDCVKKPIGGLINATGYVVLPLGWIIAHRQLGNLRITEPAEEVLSSKKFSVRIFGEVLAALEQEEWPEWTIYPFLLVDPKSKAIIAVDCTGFGKVRFKMGERETEVLAQPYARFIQGESTRPFISGIIETEYNQLMKKVFGCKFPIHLETMHPVQKDIQFRGVPQVGSSNPEVSQVVTRAAASKVAVQTEAEVVVTSEGGGYLFTQGNREYHINWLVTCLRPGHYPEEFKGHQKLMEAFDKIRKVKE